VEKYTCKTPGAQLHNDVDIIPVKLVDFYSNTQGTHNTT
jgi:hypothetical protein